MLGGHDPRGRPYFWMHEEVPLDIAEPGTDYAAVRDGKVSVTPMRFDYTADDSMGELKDHLARWVQSV
jgi:5'-nucleotidase